MKKQILFTLVICFLFCSNCFVQAQALSSNINITNSSEETDASNALMHYINNGDTNFAWEIKENYKIAGVTAYDIRLTSQKWREHVWKHQLTILVPEKIEHSGSLLFITGGSVKGNEPNWKSKTDKSTASFAIIAKKNNAIVSIVRQTPKQPLYDGLVEDQLISFTLHNFKKTKDYSWPLLFPMVKSAIRAMDAVQEFSKEKLQVNIDSFTVSGASKRGWTTWLTGASDKRVAAIAPMVIDVLNMPVSLDYQIEAWKEYSIQIEDYTKLEIPQTVSSPEGKAITTMIDPYSYRAKLTMPKLIFIGTNDEYWPVDAIKNYINDIPGENYIHYVPNAGHDLGGGAQAFKALSGFWSYTLNKKAYPKLTYNINNTKNSATIKVNATKDKIINTYYWSASSDDRDFRDEKWQSIKINKSKKSDIEHKISFPKKGFKAFYIDIEYQDENGENYTKSSRMYLVDNDEVL